MSGGSVRIDVREGGLTQLTGSRGVALLKDNPPRMELENPEKKEVVILPASALGGVLGAITNNPLIS
jgi:hypothetical protein